jgi:sugar/nucleoside kinase (ribokinase family)
MNMSVNLVVIGSVALDSLSTPKGKRERALGGSAVYFSTVASYFTRVGLVGIAGKDFAQEHTDFIKGKGVDMQGFEQVDGKTFFWEGSYADDFGDATTHKTELNVFESFNPKLPQEYRKAPFVFLANIHPKLQMSVIEQVEKPKLIALDTMNFWITGALPDLIATLKKVDVVFLNKQEALQLSGEKKLVSAYKKILTMGPKRVVIKMGELGAMTVTNDSAFFVPAFPCKNLTDPTGAGDSFAGGLMGYLAQSSNISENGFRRAMIYGSTMGSITVEGFSLDSYKELTRADMDQRYRQIVDMIKVD